MALSKTHQDYWTTRLKKRHYKMPSGEQRQVEEWQVYIQHRGRREWFKLGSNNKIAASKQAAKIYQSLIVRGWDATLEDFKPDYLVKISAPTLGVFFAAVKEVTTVTPQTFEKYCRWLRTIVAQLKGMDNDPSKYDAHKGGREQWLTTIDKTPLSFLTPEKILRWRTAFIAKADKDDNKAIKQAQRSANSAIRNARSLFSAKILKQLGGITLPTPLPFDDVDLIKGKNPRHESTVDVAALAKMAEDELSESEPEAYKIFLLALFAGLRRNEIDKLQWKSIDWKNKNIAIRPHSHFSPKTDSSSDTVSVDAKILKRLKSLKKTTVGEYVVYSKTKPRINTSYPHYRAEKTFKRLNRWLRSKGITANSPVHTLRKEFGRLITEKYGIYAASRALRHSSIQITVDYYADDTRRKTVTLSDLS